LSTTPDLDRRIEVRFSGWMLGLSNLPGAILIYFGTLFDPPGVGLLLFILGGLAVGWGVFWILASLDRRPLMVVAPDGIHLPIADAFFRYDEIEVWASRPIVRGEDDGRHHVFALQGRPRVYLDLDWWARLRSVRANTLLTGDLCFDERFITVSAKDLAGAIQARIDRATSG